MPLANEPEFLKSLIYSCHARPSDLLADVNAMRSLDRSFEVKQKTWTRWTVGLGLLIPAILFGALVVEVPVALVGIVPALAAAIFCGIRMTRFRRLNTEDRRYELLQNVTGLLQTDIASDASLRVKLVLTAPTEKGKLSRKGKAGHWNVDHYLDPWLELEGRFLDGTAFVLQVVDRVQKRSCWKKSRSGKMKRKTKEKSATVFSVRLRPKARRHARLVDLADDAHGAVQLPEGVSLKNVQITRDALALKTQLRGSWRAREAKQAVALMFLSLYQVLNLSRRISRGTPA